MKDWRHYANAALVLAFCVAFTAGIFALLIWAYSLTGPG